MNNPVIIECDEHDVSHEYLTSLPQTSIQIKSIFGHEFKYAYKSKHERTNHDYINLTHLFFDYTSIVT